MGAIGEPKREIHIPVTEPAVPVPQPVPEPEPAVTPLPGGARTGRRLTGAAMGLPWDVFATPIAARKLARLGHGTRPRRAPARVLPAARRVVRRGRAGHVPARGSRRARGRVQLRLLRGRRRHPAVAPRRRRARAGGARRRARGPGDRTRPRLPRQRPARHVGALPRRVRALRSSGRGVRASPLRRARARVPPLRPPSGRTRRGVGVARRTRRLHHRRSRAGAARPPASSSSSRSSPRPSSSCSSPPRSRSPPDRASRSRAASSRSWCGWSRCRRCSGGSASGSASPAPKRCGCNIGGVRWSPRSRSDVTSCSPSS